MTVLVTGGAGYIGSHAARALRRAGYEVVIYDDLSTGHRVLTDGFEFIEGNVADAARIAPALARVDAVMHFAAHTSVGESVTNPRKYLANNAVAGVALVNAVLDAGIKIFVFSSTSAVYGSPERVPINEEAPRKPLNPYGVSKLFLEQVLESYDLACNLRSARLRYFNAAGADEGGEVGELHDPETHLIPLALAATMADGLPLQVFGDDYATFDGTCIRDYIHVSDLVDAHVRALQYLESGGDSVSLNLGTGRGYSVLEVIAAVEKVTGRPVRRTLAPRRNGDAQELVADPARAESLWQWKPSRDLDNIVASAWEWMLKSHGLARK